MSMLQVRELQVHYGSRPVLRGVDFDIGAGEIVGLVGRNASGRSSVAKALMGLVPASGSVLWKGMPVLGRAPHEMARLGLGYVPQTRDVFGLLSTRNNLLLGRKPGARGKGPTLEDMYQLFPLLRAREHTPAGVLSGGEQQMLALARALMGEPELLITDEPTEGLAPARVADVAQALRRLREQGTSVLLMEQNLAVATQICDRVLVMGRGTVVFEGRPSDLAAGGAWQEWVEG